MNLLMLTYSQPASLFTLSTLTGLASTLPSSLTFPGPSSADRQRPDHQSDRLRFERGANQGALEQFESEGPGGVVLIRLQVNSSRLLVGIFIDGQGSG